MNMLNLLFALLYFQLIRIPKKGYKTTCAYHDSQDACKALKRQSGLFTTTHKKPRLVAGLWVAGCS
jgi:hypothetical protein